MLNKLLRTIKGLTYKKKQKSYGTFWITPYLVYGSDDAPKEVREICKAISSKLHEYQDVMVNYGRKQNSRFGFVRIQKIEANYNADNQRLEVWGSGNKCFNWSGDLAGFMGENNFLKL